jgi:hypothetical protein
MDSLEYLLGYGLRGDFGRFRPARPLACRRGDRAVVRSHRGLELAEVLCPARPGHALFLPNTSVGELLRLATPEDEAAQALARRRGQELLGRAGALAAGLGLPLEVLDAEVLLDGKHADLHHLRWAECDVRPLVGTLSREFDLYLTLTDLSGAPAAEEEGPHGCGKEGCGGGNCGSCGSGGGCSTCGVSGVSGGDVKAYFSELRERVERGRTTLL